MEKIREAPPGRFFGYYPGVVAVLTVQTPRGERNVMSAGWHSAVSHDPPLYGVAIAKPRFTHRLVVEAEAFAVNFLPFSQTQLIAGAGTLSGHNGQDKLERLDAQIEQPLRIAAPILAAAYLSYECQLEQVVPTGDHDWFVGHVVAVHYDPAAYDEQWLLDPHGATASVYLGRAQYLALEPESRRKHWPPKQFE